MTEGKPSPCFASGHQPAYDRHLPCPALTRGTWEEGGAQKELSCAVVEQGVPTRGTGNPEGKVSIAQKMKGPRAGQGSEEGQGTLARFLHS